MDVRLWVVDCVEVKDRLCRPLVDQTDRHIEHFSPSIAETVITFPLIAQKQESNVLFASLNQTSLFIVLPGYTRIIHVSLLTIYQFLKIFV
jgi:hypothetical protein